MFWSCFCSSHSRLGILLFPVLTDLIRVVKLSSSQGPARDRHQLRLGATTASQPAIGAPHCLCNVQFGAISLRTATSAPTIRVQRGYFKPR
ncbi:hypothetical protein V2G26_007059 [Clonostachys chloroleuca]